MVVLCKKKFWAKFESYLDSAEIPRTFIACHEWASHKGGNIFLQSCLEMFVAYLLDFERFFCKTHGITTMFQLTLITQLWRKQAYRAVGLLEITCKMIKYYSKLQPMCATRWSSFLVLLLVSPFLMWFIILLFGLRLCQLYNSLTPTHYSPSVRSCSQSVGHALWVPRLPSAQERDGAWITAAKPSSPWMNDFHLLTLNAILKTSQLLMISMVCLIFLGNVPDEYSFLCREDSPATECWSPSAWI